MDPKEPEDKVEEKKEEVPQMGEEPPKEEEDDGVKITPYDIQNTSNKEIDYNKLLTKFGCHPVNNTLIERI